MRSGQQQVVSVIVIVTLAIGAIATVLPWAYNMIQKKKDAKSLEDVYSFFKTLDETIRNVAKTGGEEQLTLKVPGRMNIYPEILSHPLNNSITFFFQSKVSNIALCESGDEFCWIPLNTPNTNATATLGKDTPSVISGMAEMSGNNLDITYKLWYRELYDSSTNRRYKIILNTTDDSEKITTTGFLRIQRLSSITSGNLIITEINIIV